MKITAAREMHSARANEPSSSREMHNIYGPAPALRGEYDALSDADLVGSPVSGAPPWKERLAAYKSPAEVHGAVQSIDDVDTDNSSPHIYDRVAPLSIYEATDSKLVR